MSWVKAVNLRLLIHVLGDLHQPLHATTYYSPKFPNGDRGGNEFKIQCTQKPEIKNLHYLWDWMFGYTPDTMPPVPNANKDTIRQLSTQLMNEMPITTFQQEITITDFKLIGLESNSYAASTVYVGIEPDGKVSDEYISRNIQIAKKRVALAGYRLSILLKKIISAQQ